MNTYLLWPPQHTVRRSQRARRVRLEISPKNELKIIIPNHLSELDISALLNDNKNWIERQFKKNTAVQDKAADLDNTRPSRLELLAIDENWQIQYTTNLPKKRNLRESTYCTLKIREGLSDEAFYQYLTIWLKEKAKHSLPPIVDYLSQKLKISYNKLTIRGQKTRWGSCSALGNININYKLLFFERDIVDSIIIHELCHRVHLNHSKKFWCLVKKFDPSFKRHYQQLNQQARDLPYWLN